MSSHPVVYLIRILILSVGGVSTHLFQRTKNHKAPSSFKVDDLFGIRRVPTL